jgi:hypothetical protein
LVSQSTAQKHHSTYVHYMMIDIAKGSGIPWPSRKERY